MMKILIVDDNEDSRIILRKTLESDGHTVMEAPNGAEALKAVRTSPPDMIISDILMPEMDGFRFCYEIKQIDSLRNIPFIFYTSTYVEAKDEKLAMRLGASRYIIKPLDTAEFLRTVKDVFREYSEGKQPVAERPVKEEPELFRMYEESIARKLDKKVKELRNLKEFNENIVETSPIGIHVIDRDYIVRSWNVYFEEYFGIKKEDIIGKNLFEAVPELLKIGWKKSYEKVLRTGESLEKQEYKYTQSTGTKKKILYHSTKIVPLKENGVVVGAITILEDITGRRQAEEELLRSQAELSALYKVSSAISQTIDMKELFTVILNSVTGLKILNLEPKGGIFIIEGDAMNLVHHLGYPETFVNKYKSMKAGSGYYWHAVKTGEVVVSENPDMEGCHIVIPLKVRDRILGVLSLHCRSSAEVDDHKIKILLTIGNQVGVAIDHARLYEETKKLSLHDPLTGLANRRLMDIVLERSFARAKRLESSLSALMLDIDYFKKYNDTYGHTAGDALLVRVADIILKETRGMDLVVRYGGEEFLVLLFETGLNLAYDVAERIRKSVEAKINITVSIGISSYHRDMKNKRDLIEKADEALYLAKQKGRNRVEVFKPQLTVEN
ncbi:MAG: diguanylate cyclase [Deferribacteres bacterium]|nr:diguanylate cyclase [Deferribacteres bacterium]